jgi:hypothetical protein
MADLPIIASDSVFNQPQQYLRKCTLLVGDDTGSGIDLSNLQIKFSVVSATTQTRKHMEARIYNVADQTAATVQNEFTQVQLSAGYQNGPFGVIFSGYVTQFRRGRENAVDSFLDIIAATDDIPYNWANLNISINAGWSPTDVLNAILKALKPYGVTAGSIPELPPIEMPRGKAAYGSVKDLLRGLASSQDCDWNLHDGKLNLIPRYTTVIGDVVTLNPQSGLLNSPTQTVDGLTVSSTLNPNIRPGGVIHVETGLVNTASIVTPLTAEDYIPTLSVDGQYKAYSVTHVGDTRGQEWFTESICAALDPINGQVVGSQRFIQAIPGS